MELTQAQIRKFKALYYEHFSIELSDDEAAEKGLSLVLFLKHTYKPLPANENEKSNEKQKTRTS